MKRSLFEKWLYSMLCGCLLLAASCTSVTYDSGDLHIIISDVNAVRVVGDDIIDCAEIVGFDANGNQVYGPIREFFSAEIVWEDVPADVTKVTVDYLRNCGYPLKVSNFDVDFEDDGIHVEANPIIQAHPAPTSVWTAGTVAAMAAEYSPSPAEACTTAGKCALKMNGSCFKIKGMCYSPSPIKYDASKFPALGDLFWDSYRNPADGNTIWNWYSLWGNGQLYGDFYARDDLNTMRGLGVNAVRLYAVMSRQPFEQLPKTDPPTYYFPDDPASGAHYEHEMFLDKCYDNGNNPIYVLVGIPMVKALFQKGLPLQKNEQKFWEHMLVETAKDVGGHPAVMGFTIMNEENAVPWSHLDGGDTASSDKTDQFYYNSIQYGNSIKAQAPGKLAGWATTNCPQLYRYASLAKFTDGPLKGKTYLSELAKAFDYWGVNTYEKSTFETILGDTDPANGLTFKHLPDNAKKPVIFTELGWPSTGRAGDVKEGEIMYNDTTGANTAKVLTNMFGLAYGCPYADLFAGAFYFEFSDEWWKSGDATKWNKTPGVVAEPNAWPNWFNDQEGYGLFASKKGAGKKDTDNIWCGSGPCLPQDEYLPRLKVTDAITEVYKNKIK